MCETPSLSSAQGVQSHFSATLSYVLLHRHARGKLGFTEASSVVLEFFGNEHLKK